MAERKRLSRDEIELRDIFRILKKRYKMIVLITMAALLISIGVNSFVLTPVYSTNAVMMVSQVAAENTAKVNSGQGLEGLVNSISIIPAQTMNSYVGQLESNAVMERVIKKLKLDREGYIPGTLSGLVSVTPVPETNLINIYVNHTNPFVAQKIANAITSEFLTYVTESNQKQLARSLETLERQVKTTDEELDVAIESLNNLEAEQNGVTILNQLVNAKIAELNQVRSQLIQARAEYRQLVAGIDLTEDRLKVTLPVLQVVTGTDDAGVSKFVEQPNPTYNTLNSMLLQKSINAEEMDARIAELSAMEGQIYSELLQMEVELNQKSNIKEAAENEVNRLQETYSLLRSKINEAQIAKSLKLGETGMTIVSDAPIPGYPVKPNKSMNIMISVVLGLMISVILAFLLNYLDNTIKTAQEAEEFLGLPVLGHIPPYKPFKGVRSGTAPVTQNLGRSADM
ncbi:GumC family protein [Phosphitispora sp. TUW77]|uniref:GumC family protein n=1 Tax=Phosphitispora sp. TUW77 TaxID=3152361 RepID=UPI003AB7936F